MDDQQTSGVERLARWKESMRDLLEWHSQEAYLREKLNELGYDYDDPQLLIATHKDHAKMKIIFILERDHDL